jgi:hypothetical protein
MRHRGFVRLFGWQSRGSDRSQRSWRPYKWDISSGRAITPDVIADTCDGNLSYAGDEGDFVLEIGEGGDGGWRAELTINLLGDMMAMRRHGLMEAFLEYGGRGVAKEDARMRWEGRGDHVNTRARRDFLSRDLWRYFLSI